MGLNQAKCPYLKRFNGFDCSLGHFARQPKMTRLLPNGGRPGCIEEVSWRRYDAEAPVAVPLKKAGSSMLI